MQVLICLNMAQTYFGLYNLLCVGRWKREMFTPPLSQDLIKMDTAPAVVIFLFAVGKNDPLPGFNLLRPHLPQVRFEEK